MTTTKKSVRTKTSENLPKENVQVFFPGGQTYINIPLLTQDQTLQVPLAQYLKLKRKHR